MDFARVRAVQVKLRRWVSEGWEGARRGMVDEDVNRAVVEGGMVYRLIGVAVSIVSSRSVGSLLAMNGNVVVGSFNVA